MHWPPLVPSTAATAVAQEDLAALEAPHQVTGEAYLDVFVTGGTEHDAERGVLERYGWLWSGGFEMDDPRLSGTVSSLWNTDAASSGKIRTGTIALVSDVGTWVGTARGYAAPAQPPVYEHLFLELTGTGGYAGHSALLYWHGLQDEMRWDVDGFVFPGALPPYPDPVELPAE